MTGKINNNAFQCTLLMKTNTSHRDMRMWLSSRASSRMKDYPSNLENFNSYPFVSTVSNIKNFVIRIRFDP